MADPLIGIVMGSQSDWATMRAAAEMLAALGVPHEVRIVSAHRTPDRMFAYAEAAAGRGLAAIIAGAGGAAHLPGMLAAKTRVPVLGVPVAVQGALRARFAALDRADAEGRAGRHPCHRRGGRGERRAACRGDAGDAATRPRRAARRLARGADRRRWRRRPMAPEPPAAGQPHRHPRRRPARADAGAGRGAARACGPTSSSPPPTPAPDRWPSTVTRAGYDDRAALARLRGRRSTS